MKKVKSVKTDAFIPSHDPLFASRFPPLFFCRIIIINLVLFPLVALSPHPWNVSQRDDKIK